MKINTFLSSGVVSHIHLEKVTVSHLNRAGNGDYNWVFPDKEEQFEIDKNQILSRNYNVSYAKSATRIRCSVDDRTIEFIQNELCNA